MEFAFTLTKGICNTIKKNAKFSIIHLKDPGQWPYKYTMEYIINGLMQNNAKKKPMPSLSQYKIYNEQF